MKTLELTNCPACGSRTFRGFDLGGGNLLRRCAFCHTVSAAEYADPAEVYVDGYMFGDAGQFGLDVRPEPFQRYLMRVANRRVNMIERATRLAAGRWLDVGSGTGEVLLAAGSRGWQPTGVEPERTAAEMARARGLEVHIAHLEEAGLPEQSFDVVSAFHVLEHLPDSRSFLRGLARWCRSGGFVAVEVPNWRSVQRRRLRERWSGLRPHEHLVHFSPDTLAGAFRAAGIEPVLVRSPSYLGPPQNLDQAFWDLTRYRGRLHRILGLPGFSRPDTVDGEPVRLPTRAGWTVLGLAESLYDRAGVGSVVVCVGRAP